MKRPVLFTNV